MSHVFREVNKCANVLTKRGCSLQEDSVVFNSPPFVELSKTLSSDAFGLFYYWFFATTFPSLA